VKAEITRPHVDPDHESTSPRWVTWRPARRRSRRAPAIRLWAVEKRFPRAAEPAVTDLHLDIPEGRLVVFVGPSGCGKTTTLKMINRLIEPTAGEIHVLGTEIRSIKKPQLGARSAT
jgi:osmoprotectant transport system ATP-binding protein